MIESCLFMCILNEPDTYYESLLQDAYSLLSYRIHELGKYNYIDNFITTSSIKLSQPCVI